jgi:hypothetical protein
MKRLILVDAVEWCGYSKYYEVEGEIDEGLYEEEFANSHGLLLCEHGWYDPNNIIGTISQEDCTTIQVSYLEGEDYAR